MTAPVKVVGIEFKLAFDDFGDVTLVLSDGKRKLQDKQMRRSEAWGLAHAAKVPFTQVTK